MKQNNLVPKGILVPFILVTSLFFAWGLANNMTDTLLAAFKRIMSMSDFQTSWVHMAFYTAYFLLALPAAILIKKYSYKTGIIVGLIFFIVGGLGFYPASQTMVYGHFLVTLYILAAGLSILETSCNPYIIAMGPEETATRRLNLAQSFNPIGSITGAVLSKLFILSHLHSAGAAERAQMTQAQLASVQSDELNAMMGPYIGVSLVLCIILFLMFTVKMPSVRDKDTHLNLRATAKRLYRNKKYFYGIIAQFFYVGAQIVVWSFTIRYVMKELSLTEEQASNFYILSLIVFVSARFIFTALMKYITPSKLLQIAGIMAMVCCFFVVTGHGYFGVFSLVAVSFFMSLMFPTIYGLTITGLGDDTKIAGSGHIMAIFGGAVMTTLQGQLSDATKSINYSYTVPLICFILVAAYGLYIHRVERK